MKGCPVEGAPGHAVTMIVVMAGHGVFSTPPLKSDRRENKTMWHRILDRWNDVGRIKMNTPIKSVF